MPDATDLSAIEIREIVVQDHYLVVADLMRQLHENERLLSEKTALWQEIELSYMRHVITMQQECEGTFLIAYLVGKPVGFIFGYIEEQDDSRIEIFEGLELYVSDGFVVPEMRGKGVYKALNKLLEAMFVRHGVKRIFRFTLANNSNARRFFEKEGYKVTRVLYEKWL